MRVSHAVVTAALSFLPSAFHFALADCPAVLPLNGGANSYVHALAEYNGQLIAGGDFTIAGGQSVNHIARWDGSNWTSLGGPFGTVRLLTVFNGELIVSGGGSLLGRWNGTSWQTQNTPNGAVYAFGVYNGEFIIGGQFFVNSNFVNVLRWNFATGQWVAIGAPGTFGTYSVKALTVYNGQLIAGGDFFVLNGNPVAGLARWNEAAGQWQPFESGLNNNGQVYGLTVYKNDLIVVGGFTTAGGVYSRGVVRWNAANGWQSMAGGVSSYVDTVTEYHGDLIIGGYFTSAGSSAVNNIARWNDSVGNWQSVGTGVTNCCGYGAAVYTVTVSNGKLFGGGWFGFGEVGPQRIVAWEDCLPCPPDVSGDHSVNVTDLLAVINGWGPCGKPCPADITGDGQINVNDLLAVINAWGPCP